MKRLRLLTISHSYPVALNRRLAAELAWAGSGRWEVTALAPKRFRGDLRIVDLERHAGEPNALTSVPAHCTRSPHLFFYGPSLAPALRAGWDCVHLWEEPYVLAGAQVAAWTPRSVPVAFVTYQNILKRYPPPFRQLERFVLKRASGWIAGSETVAQALGVSALYRSRPSVTIPLGVDIDAFQPQPSVRREALRRLSWRDNGTPVVGFLGRFVPEKGIGFLMSVLDRVPTQWRALLVGGGPMASQVHEWAARYGDRVRVVPPVTHDEVPLYLNAMDVLCAPSETKTQWREQLGRMIIEAFACGVPVVGSDSGEIPFTIGNAGLILPERDEASWTAALGELLENSERRRNLAATGRERAMSHFAWQVVARKTLQFLDRVVGKQTSSPPGAC